MPLAIGGHRIADGPAVAQGEVAGPSFFEGEAFTADAAALGQHREAVGGVGGDRCVGLGPDRDRPIPRHGDRRTQSFDVVIAAIELQHPAIVGVAAGDGEVEAALVVVGGVAGAKAEAAQHRFVVSSAGFTAEAEHAAAAVVAHRNGIARCGAQHITADEGAAALLHQGHGGTADRVVSALIGGGRLGVQQPQAGIHQHRRVDGVAATGTHHQGATTGGAEQRRTVAQRRDADGCGGWAARVGDAIGAIPAEAGVAAEAAIRAKAQPG